MHRSTPVLQFSAEVQTRSGRRRPKFDWLLSTRKPPLEVDTDVLGNAKIRIDPMYLPGDEIRQSPAPYVAFAEAIDGAGVLSGIESVLDLGCSTGFLISALMSQHPHLKAAGVEIFSYQVDAAPPDVRSRIHVHDLRDVLPTSLVSDLVICTEVGEHIDPASLGNFMNNLATLCRKGLVLTWSSAHPPAGAPPQHVSSLSPRTVRRLMRSYGFSLDKPTTQKLTKELTARADIYYWWLDSLSVWRPTLPPANPDGI